MRRIFYLTLSILIIVALILVKIFLIDGTNAPTTSIHRPVPILTDVYIAKDTIPQFEVDVMGSVKAVEKVDIYGELNRKITGIHFAEGSYIRKGCLLFKLDDREILSELEQLAHEEKLAFETLKRNKVLFDNGGASAQLIDESETKLNVIKARTKYLNTIFDKTEIKAPFSGIIGIRHVSPGALIDPKTTLTTLFDISNVYIDFALPEKYFSAELKNKMIDFTTLANNEIYNAKITAVQPSIDSKTRTIMVRAVTPNPKGKLKPGASVKVHLAISDMDRSIYVPTNSLIPTMKGYSVYLLKDGIVVESSVDIGIRNKSSAQILSGISHGDTVITTNLLKIAPGTAVSVAKIIE